MNQLEVQGQACRVKVIACSSYVHGQTLWTLQLRYPRFIHSEFMTHRVFSRNASSSRAIPVKTMLEQVRVDPAMPVRFGGNKPGMQDTGAEHVGMTKWDVGASIKKVFESSTLNVQAGVIESDGRSAWRTAAIMAADQAEALSNAGYHKQVVNRLIEPFQYISVVVTATEWSNFFALRDNAAADPTMHDLAVTMRAAMEIHGTPIFRASGRGHERHWHLPYVSDAERQRHPLPILQKLSVARCARVSYLSHDGRVVDETKDVALAKSLSANGHWSPFEHQAAAGESGLPLSNLHGWCQLRRLVEAHPTYLD